MFYYKEMGEFMGKGGFYGNVFRIIPLIITRMLKSSLLSCVFLVIGGVRGKVLMLVARS